MSLAKCKASLTARKYEEFARKTYSHPGETPSTGKSLLDLPPEVLLRIAMMLGPVEYIMFGRTCKQIQETTMIPLRAIMAEHRSLSTRMLGGILLITLDMVTRMLLGKNEENLNKYLAEAKKEISLSDPRRIRRAKKPVERKNTVRQTAVPWKYLSKQEQKDLRRSQKLLH